MAWLIAIPMLLAAIFKGNNAMLIASALFAIAGSIDIAFHEPSEPKEDKKE